VGQPPAWGPVVATDSIAADFDGYGRLSSQDALGIPHVAVGMEAGHAPRWMFLGPEADLTGIGRANAPVEPGLQLDPIGTDLGLVGILSGYVQQFG
jgi:hypothetical protein